MIYNKELSESYIFSTRRSYTNEITYKIKQSIPNIDITNYLDGGIDEAESLTIQMESLYKVKMRPDILCAMS